MENVLDKAREAGMAVLLDACIGRERFHSVVGSEAHARAFCPLVRDAGGGSRDPQPVGGTVRTRRRRRGGSGNPQRHRLGKSTQCVNAASAVDRAMK